MDKLMFKEKTENLTENCPSTLRLGCILASKPSNIHYLTRNRQLTATAYKEPPRRAQDFNNILLIYPMKR
jgi:hypothetical protein